MKDQERELLLKLSERIGAVIAALGTEDDVRDVIAAVEIGISTGKVSPEEAAPTLRALAGTYGPRVGIDRQWWTCSCGREHHWTDDVCSCGLGRGEAM